MTDSRVDFSVIIPVYNEAGSIGTVLERLLTQLRGMAEAHEVVIVSDGSVDGTVEEVRKVGEEVRLIEHPYNMGNGAAVKTGMRHARGEILIVMDADGQHDPGEIPRFLEECRRYDMVVGARGAGSQAGWHRGLANWFYNRFAGYVTGRQIGDLTSGYRALRRDVARRFVGLLPNGFSYPTTITLCLLRAGFSVRYIPIQVAPRQGKSKIRIVSDGTRFLLIIMKICMLFSPLKIFLPVSLYLFLMAVGYYGYTFWTEHRFTNMSMLLFTTSVMIFMMGLVAEQIAQMRFEREEPRPTAPNLGDGGGHTHPPPSRGAWENGRMGDGGGRTHPPPSRGAWEHGRMGDGGGRTHPPPSRGAWEHGRMGDGGAPTTQPPGERERGS